MNATLRTLPTALAELPVATIDTGRIRAALLAGLDFQPYEIDAKASRGARTASAFTVHHIASLLGLMDVAETASFRIDSHVAGGEVQP